MAAEEARELRAARAVPVIAGKEPAARYGSRPRLWISRRTRLARHLHQVIPRPRGQKPWRRHRLADPGTIGRPARPGCRRRRGPSTRRRRPAPMIACPLTTWDRPSCWSVSPNRPPRHSSGARAQAAAQRSAGNLPGPGPRVPADAEKRPGPSGLGPARNALPRRPTGPGADRLRARRGEPARAGPAAV